MSQISRVETTSVQLHQSYPSTEKVCYPSSTDFYHILMGNEVFSPSATQPPTTETAAQTTSSSEHVAKEPKTPFSLTSHLDNYAAREHLKPLAPEPYLKIRKETYKRPSIMGSYTPPAQSTMAQKSPVNHYVDMAIQYITAS